MFRHQKLRHLRIEQLVRYFSSSSGASKSEQETNEDTTAPDDEAIGVDVHHRSPNFNSFFSDSFHLGGEGVKQGAKGEITFHFEGGSWAQGVKVSSSCV